MKKQALTMLCIAGLGAATSVWAQGPAWWYSRNVVDTNLQANDYALITLGQLKWIATNAYAEMEASFDAGTNLDALMASFSNSNNYYLANIGQVKYVAQSFYDRLYALNLTNIFPANMPGYYPWGNGQPTNDYALANIGQVKYVFSFDLTVDTDQDGMPDWWEVAHDLDPQDPDDASLDPDNDGKTNLEEYQLDTDPNEFNLWVVFDRESETVAWTAEGQYDAAARLATNSLQSNLIWSVQCVEGSAGEIDANGVFSFGVSNGIYTITAQSGDHPLVSDSLELTVVSLESLTLADASGVPSVEIDENGQVGESGDTLYVIQDKAGHADCQAVLVWHPASASNMIWQIASRIGDTNALAGWTETHGTFTNNVIAPLEWTDAEEITNREFTVQAGCDGDGNGILGTNEVQRTLDLTVLKADAFVLTHTVSGGPAKEDATDDDATPVDHTLVFRSGESNNIIAPSLSFWPGLSLEELCTNAVMRDNLYTQLLWTIESKLPGAPLDGWVGTNACLDGQTNSNLEWTEAEQTNREFIVRAGYDRNGDSLLETSEYLRLLNIIPVTLDSGTIGAVRKNTTNTFQFTMNSPVPITLRLTNAPGGGQATFAGGVMATTLTASATFAIVGVQVSQAAEDIEFSAEAADGQKLYSQPFTVLNMNPKCIIMGGTNSLNMNETDNMLFPVLANGQSIGFTMTIEPAGLESQLYWYAEGGNPESGQGASFSTSWAVGGIKQVQVWFGGIGTGTLLGVITVVVANVTSVSAEPQTATTGYYPIYLIGTTDPAGYEEYLSWSVGDRGNYYPWEAPGVPGEYTVTATMGSSEASTTVYVYPWGTLEMVFDKNPVYPAPDGDTNVVASLELDDWPWPWAADWSFVSNSLGCSLAPSNGATTTITLGAGLGNLQIAAQSWLGASGTLVIQDLMITNIQAAPTPGESRPLIPDGQSTLTLEVGVYPASKIDHMEWKIMGESLGCAVQGSGKNAVVLAGRRAGSIRVRAYDSVDTNIIAEIDVTIGCPCGSGFCGLASGRPNLDSVDLSINLGRASDGSSAGTLSLREQTATTNMATPRALKCLAMPGVQTILASNALRQVKAAEGLLDIVTLDNFSYEIRAYDAAQVGAMQGGLYTTSGDPALVWRIANPDASTNTFNRLWISQIVPGKTNLSEFTWSEEENAWELVQGDGLRIETLAEDWDEPITNRTETRCVMNDAEEVVSKSAQVFHVFPWGEELTTNVMDPDGAALTASYTFYENAAETGRYSRPKTTLNPDGSWAGYDYAGPMQPSQEISAWKDSAAGSEAQNAKAVAYSYTPVDGNDTGVLHPYSARTETVSVLGTVVSKTYRAWYENGSDEEVAIEERCASSGAAYGAAGNLLTITAYYATNASAAEACNVKSIAYPDGRLDSFEYEAGTYVPSTNPAECAFSPGAGDAIRKTVIHGTTNAPSGISGKTTIEVQVFDKGRPVLQETWVYTGSGSERIAWTVQVFDALGHATAVYRSNNSLSEAVWGCCGKESETDENGVETAYYYDDLNRLELTVKAGTNGGYNIQTAYTCDAAGNRLTVEQSAGGLSLVTSNQYDLAGRLVQTVDAAGLVTTYAYANGGRTETVTQPGGATQITENYLDGRVKSVTGTAAPARYYDYGVNEDGSQWTTIYTGATNSPVWEKTTTDFLGRTAKVEKPGYSATETTENFYNSKGQLVKTTTSGQPDTLFAYDEIGNQIQSGLDINANGELDLASTDRISETDTSYLSISSDWWLQSISRIYATDNSATPLTNSVTRQRLTGFTEPLNSEHRTLDSLGNETVTTTTVDRNAKTVTQTIDVPDSSSNIVTITINGLVQSITSKSGNKTTFGYDALGRQTSVIDPRTGTATTYYDAHGWIDYVEDAENRRTSYTYESSTGRTISQTDPMSNTIYFSYTTQGQPEKTWGATYPVWNEYDAYGRKTKQHTYRSGEGFDGSTWPSGVGEGDVTEWKFQESTGLLTNKTDAAGKSVSYTYAANRKPSTRVWARTDGTNALISTYSYSTNSGDLTGIDYSDSTPDVTFTYDRLGRQKTAESSVSSHTFSYQILNLQSEIVIRSGITNTITRNYDGYGRPTGFALDSDYSVSYQYDTSGRFSSLSSSVESVSSVVNYSYLPNSDLISGFSESGSGLQVSKAYEDHRNLITQIKNEFGTNLISQFDYLNDSIGRRTQRIDFGGPTNDFAYNPRSELTNAVMGTNGFGYQYDPIGNRISSAQNDESKSYLANELNQYTNIADGVTNSLNYDADGNLTNDAVFAYVFNAENRLIASEPLAPSNGSRRVEYAYDYQGRRAWKKAYSWDGTNWNTSAEEVRKNIYDGFNLIAETFEMPTATNILFYTWGLDLSGTLQGAGGAGGLLSMTRQSLSATNIFYYCADAGGNITDMADTNGTSVAAYQYSPFGEIVSATGTEATNNTMTFSSKPWDGDIREYGYIFRDYEPDSGRWTSQDPLGNEGGVNLYEFVINDAINKVDLYGLKWQIQRNGTRRAVAIGESCDSISELAKLAKMEPSQSMQWLNPPQTPDYKLEGNSPKIYTIPNVVYFNQLSLKPPWIGFSLRESVQLLGEKYKVVDAIQLTRGSLIAQFNDPDVFGIVHINHGEPDSVGGPIFADSNVAVRPNVITLHHKLGGLKLITCYAGQGSWGQFVSVYGKYWATPYAVITMMDPGVIPLGFDY